MDWDSLPTLDDLLEQNLLTPEQGQELEQWFQASCRANLRPEAWGDTALTARP
jgi:hypothetical protein